MKHQLIKILINGLIGVLTSVATLYLGGQGGEVIAVSGATTATIGQRASEAVAALLA